MKKYNLKHRIEYKVINLNIDQEWNCTEKKNKMKGIIREHKFSSIFEIFKQENDISDKNSRMIIHKNVRAKW